MITAAGVDREEGIIDAAINLGIITKSGSFLKHGEKMLGQGKETVKETLASDEKLRHQILKEIEEKSQIKTDEHTRGRRQSS